MTHIHHINCGTLLLEGYPTVVCHCLLLEDADRLTLVDTGIGLLDVRHPVERLGQELIDLAGFQFNEQDTAIRRIETVGFSSTDVKHIILTHGDPDHTGGLADFPDAQVHLSTEEAQSLSSEHKRYVETHFAHGPRWQVQTSGERDWFGLESRRIDLGDDSDVRLIPLFGHTLGHCGVAIRQDDRWLLHVGDAYYLRLELTDEAHPVCSLAAQRCLDNEWRQASLRQLRRLSTDHNDEIEMVGYHDISELPDNAKVKST